MNSNRQGRIITFYSYKGGVGRSMALANVAWILASNGRRVLAVDWDLEAPGLHRYLHPFLVDRNLTASPGLIDLMWDFAAAATAKAQNAEELAQPWHESYSDIQRYTIELDRNFPFPGRLDLIPAGQQTAAYAARVNSFDWKVFYDRLGGGTFLESIKTRMREAYDYILIDSRTGVSDTSGICTVQMPDDLVVGFTANDQSIHGGVAAAGSVWSQWSTDKARPHFGRIFPVFMRADSSEMDKLDAAKSMAWSLFEPYLGHLHQTQRKEYHGSAVVPYIAWFSYEEVLATIRDKPEDRNSLLDAFQRLAGYLTNGAVTRVNPPNDEERNEILAKYARRALPTIGALHQLPASPSDFIGRENELADLRNALKKGGATISGMGGIGKTALALKLAEQLKPSFPDAQIYLDLRGVAPQPLTPYQAMAHVVRSLHPDIRLPESLDEVAALYRSVLDGKKALLVMDNAAGREQVEPLVPPKSCLLLVTSRFRFTLPGFMTRDLDTLPLAEAEALLLRIEPRIGRAAEEFAHLCGGLPLALRLVGGALAERPDLSPSRYAQKLSEAQRRLDLIDASLTLSYDLLSEDLQRSWRELAIFPSTFDVEAAAATWAVDLALANEVLGSLVKSSLVDGAEGRYRLHDLARLFAESRLEESESAGACSRHANHFLSMATKAEQLYLRGGESLLAGLRLFDLEWSNIQAGFAWAAERFTESDTAARICTDYPDVCSYCLHLRQPPREQVRWLDSAVQASKILGDQAAEGRHLGRLGIAYQMLGDSRRAIDLYEQELKIARGIGDRRSEGQGLRKLGNAYAALGEARHAVQLYEQQLQIAREIGDRRGEGQGFGDLGNAYAVLGDARRAIEHFEQQLQIAREIGDRRSEGQSLGNLGNAYVVLGDVHRALEHHHLQLQIAHELGDRRGEGQGLGDLGNAYAALGDVQRAIDLYMRQIQIAREIEDRRSEGQGLGDLGNAYAALGDARRAIKLYEQQLQISREIGDKSSEANASWNLGLRYVEGGDLERALELIQRSINCRRLIGQIDAEVYAAQAEEIRARLEGDR